VRATVAVVSRSDPIDETVLESHLLAVVPFPDAAAVRSRRWSSPDRRLAIVVASNEPNTNPADLIRGHTDETRWTHVGQLRMAPRVVANERLAQTIAETPGRFSLLAVDPVKGRLVAVTSPSGAEPLFVAKRSGLVVVSSWAGVVARLVNQPPHEFDRVAICSMINNGFMATRRTPYPTVRSLTPAAALVVDRGGAWTIHDHLAELIAGQGRGNRDRIDILHEAFLTAIAPLREAEAPIQLSLSGGKDSRLILAGLMANGIDVRASTLSRGGANAPDVELAIQVARLAGIPHHIYFPEPRGHSADDKHANSLADIHHTLRVTDGMLHGYRTFVRTRAFRVRPIALGGGGGEVLRGGYGHGFFSRSLRPPAALVSSELMKRFTRFSNLLAPTVVAEFAENLRSELLATSAGLSGIQLLDRAYLDYRSSCWLAMSLRAESLNGISVHPSCDNALVSAALCIDPAERSSERTVYELMRRLSPKLAALPFADDEWGFRRSIRRRASRLWNKRLGATKPVSASSAPNPDWHDRFHLPPLHDHFLHTINGACHTSGLDEVVNGEALRTLMTSAQWAPPRYTQAAFNLYSAAVICSREWASMPDSWS
jgi:asparagine synthetase B (glutamine-hydrolysing)